MDLDFCAVFMTIEDTLTDLLEKQRVIKGRGLEQRKALALTCAERSLDKNDVSFTRFLEWHRSMFGRERNDHVCEVLSKQPIKLGGKINMNSNQSLYAHIYGFNTDDYIQREFILKYNAAGGPMFTWLIEYKN
jgi:hypothetical protein